MNKKLFCLRTMLSLALGFLTLCAQAQQKEKFDLASYSIPDGWQKVNSAAGVVAYAITNNQKNTWCQVALYASTASKGSIQADFESEWSILIANTYKPKSNPEITPPELKDGWNAQAGIAPFDFNGAPAAAMLVVSSGYGRCMSIVVLTNTTDYQGEIEKFLETVDLTKPTVAAPTVVTTTTGNLPAGNTAPTEVAPAAKSSSANNFKFSSTNFDDGWVSTIHDEWVQVDKGDITVLLHFNADKIDVSSADHATISTNAWNTLVAPRYSNLANYHALGSTLNYERPSLISGEVTSNQTGKRVFVSLFKKGKSGWVEIICPNKVTFVNTFGVDGPKVDYYADDAIWNTLLKLPGYNKFAVDAADLTGTWSTSFSGMTQYVNAYTGANAGMDTHSSNEKFEFGPGNTYKWNIGAASGFVGNIKYQSAKSNGTFSVPNNWQVSFSDIEGKPKTYNAFFSCVKGARILWFDDTGFARVQ